MCFRRWLRDTERSPISDIKPLWKLFKNRGTEFCEVVLFQQRRIPYTISQKLFYIFLSWGVGANDRLPLQNFMNIANGVGEADMKY
ncbi:MAG: hypothetical protein F6K24_22935 [Okeania sp. SIO2D1]|uniref:hypothetical protein n=1 Tax=Okeania sp. SIO2C9 TaxID=2607791 RepID=UPI0013B7EA49|nr:hypothetical protein [Okeania sp. SIO2C9]NEQ73527.1 hypothetical protein [Okeania sp. SIO2C9]NES67893.1 hypothetical protein [Okeania sp. SIO2D1]